MELRHYQFENPDTHLPIPEGVSPLPVMQFLSEVEEILITHDLI